MVRVDSVNPFQPVVPQINIRTIADLVKLAESNPSPLDAFTATQQVKTGPLADQAGAIVGAIYPALAAAGESKLLEVFKQADQLLGTMRKSVAAGRAFELARSQMGTQNTQLAGLLGTAIDTPDKMNFGWAFFHLAVIELQGVANGQLGTVIK